MGTWMRVLSSLALASLLGALKPSFEERHGVRLDLTLLPTALLLPRIRAGARGDVAILTAAGLAALVEERVIVSSTRRDLAVSSVGIAVRAGAPRPSIRTTEELVDALLAAKSVALSRSGASGLYFEGLLDRLGIGAAVRAKVVTIESGYTAELAADGRAELAVQQVSELAMVPGIDMVGPLPPGLGAETVFAGGVFAGAGTPELAAALLREIVDAPALLAVHGLAPV